MAVGGASAAPKDCSKLVARNVAFEATEREVRDVFKTFGELKSVRLPKKVTGSHRGFAFVEFQVTIPSKYDHTGCLIWPRT